MTQSLVHRLKLFEEKNAIYVNYYGEKSQQISDQNLEDVIETVKYLAKSGKKTIKINNGWKRVFLRRLRRTLTRAERLSECLLETEEVDDDDDNVEVSEEVEEEGHIRLQRLLLEDFWRQYSDECRYVLQGRVPIANSHIRSTFLKVKDFEKKLERRKKEYFESVGKRRHTLRELCKVHRVIFNEYFERCINLHSTLPVVLNLGIENVRELLQENSGEEECLLSTFELTTLNTTIEIPLCFASATLEDIDTSPNSSNESAQVSSFLPFVKDASLEGTLSFKNILSVLRSYRWSVILGDPGSGKTTLLRWLTVQFANFLRQGETEKFSIDGRNEWETLAAQISLINCPVISLARVPILIRAGEFATWLDSNPGCSLFDYIGQHTWDGILYTESNASSAFHELIRHGHTLILIDGLDEVMNYVQRKKIVSMIESFIEKYVQTSSFVSVKDGKELVEDWGGCLQDYPEFLFQRNQIIVTSRVIGYNLVPLKGSLFTLFSLTPINKREIESFISNWFANVERAIVSCINNGNRFQLNLEKLKRFNDTTKRKAFILTQQLRICAHPVLLSLLLPSLILTDTDQTDFTSRASVYDLIKKIMIEECISSKKTSLDAVAIEWILRDLAIHIYKHCSSDWIDTFDLTRLVFVSLKALAQQRNNVHMSNDALNTQVKDFVDLLSSNVAGFASARGLDAYGFIHRTLEEYFVALTIIDSLMYDNILSVHMTIDRLFNYMWKAEYHEPLALAIGWLDLKYKSDDMDALCFGLMERRFSGLPIGCFLLIDNLVHLNSIRSSRMITLLSNYIIFSSTADKVSKEYLRRGLNSLTQKTVARLFEDLLSDPNRVGLTCEFLLYCMEPVPGEDIWTLPLWMSNSIVILIGTWDNKDVNIQTVVDLMFRRAAPLSRKIADNSLQSLLIDKTVSINEIHPAILAIVIALCGGIMKVDNSVVFDPLRMHRVTPLASLLIDCFNKDIHAAAQSIQRFFNTCQTIISGATTDDVSKRTQDALIALIILQGVTDLNIFQRFSHYKVFPCALYQLKLVLYHLRQLYVVQKNRFDNCSLSFTGINLYLNDLQMDKNVSGQVKDSLMIAIIEACKHLTFPNIKYWMDIKIAVQFSTKEKRNEELMTYSLKYLRFILTFSLTDELTARDQWKRGEHPYQLFREHPLFLTACVAVPLQFIFERFILRNRTDPSNPDMDVTLYVVLIAEVLLYVDEQDMRTFEVLSLFSIIENIVQHYRLETYTAAIVQTIKTTRYEYRPGDDEISIPVDVDLAVVKTSIEKEQERISTALHLSDNVRVTETDLQLFSAALSITRMCEFVNEQKELFERAIQAAQSIQDNILRILCLRHMRKIVYRWPDTATYFALQIFIEDDLKKLSHNLPLIIQALVLVSCIEEQEKMHPLLNNLLDNTLTLLNQSPNDEEDARDQKSVFHALQAIVGLKVQIPSSFQTQQHLSDNLELNSSILHSLLFHTKAFPSSFLDNVLLCQLYLAELTIDAHTLTTLLPFSGNFILRAKPGNPTENLFKFLKWDYPKKKFSHYWLVSANKYMYSTPARRIEQVVPLDDRILQKEIDVRDRPMTERWLLYYNDKDNEGRCQFALLAVTLLLRNVYETLSSSVMERVFRILERSFFHDMDNIRYQARTAFSGWYYKNNYVECKAWMPWMWRVLQRIWIHALSFPKIHVESTEDIKLVLELEHDRLSAPVAGDDAEVKRFSFFPLIGSYSQDVHSYLVAYIRSVLSNDSAVNDEHIATLIVHLIEVETAFDSEIQNIHFFVLLKTIVCEQHSLPFTQRAAFFGLISREDGRHFLEDTMRSFQRSLKSKAKSIMTHKQTQHTDNVLILCLWASADVPIEHRFIEKSFFKSIEKLSKSADITLHAAACYGWVLWMDKKYDESVDDMELRLGVSTDFLYSVLLKKRQYTIETDENSNWRIYTVELVKNHWSELADRFLEDCYASLCNSSRTLNYFNRVADFLFVACELAEQEPASFSETVRRSVYGEEAFKMAIYRSWKKGNVQQRRMCIELYSVFEVATVDWINMLFTDFPDLYQYDEVLFASLNEIENRDAIESIFPYLKCDSMGKRYLAAKFLVHLVINESISSLEVSQLLEDALNDPTSNQLLYELKAQPSKSLKEHIQRLLLTTTCLGQIFERQSLAVLTPEQVTADFYECLEALRDPFHKLESKGKC